MRFSSVLCLGILFCIFASPAGAGGWSNPQTPVDFLRVIKSKRILEAWRDNIRVRTCQVSPGDDPSGYKLKEGDGKTPEGTCTLNYRKADSNAYKAMHISYPNETDRKRGREAGVKPGGAIMLHGQ